MPVSKLSVDQVAQIKLLLSHGQSAAEIAKEFCVSNGTIYKIKNGERWPDVRPATMLRFTTPLDLVRQTEHEVKICQTSKK